MTNSNYRYWGYLHVNGELKLRDYLGEESKLDMQEADKSPMTVRCYGPFWALSADEASRKLEQMMKESQIV